MTERLCECGCGQPIPWKKHHEKSPPKFISGHNSRLEERRKNCANASAIRSKRASEVAARSAKQEKHTCECGCGQEIPWQKHHKYHPPRFLHGHNTNAADYKKLRKEIAQKPPIGWIPPTGLCECGCGGRTTIVKMTNISMGRYAGFPNRYINGHERRGKTLHESHNWNGGRTRTAAGYIKIKRPGHPRASSNGYVLEHIIVWETANCRTLLPNESVHHVNGIKDDNRPENLVALTRNAHSKLHADEAEGKAKRAAALKQRSERIRAERAPPPGWIPPSGICECGCGGKTTIAKITIPKHGHYAGYPMRFILGHNARMKKAKQADKSQS